MMSKKSQGLSINVVILIILGIIVFAVLTYIFYNTSKSYSSETGDAPGRVKGSFCSNFGRCLPDSVVIPYTTPVTEPQGGWLDCPPPKKCYSKNP